ncbi:MAG: glycosyltransferase [Xanthomonadales bacterium]|nr:glycosyltransferase [Xanthomonadales bacterium]MCC6596438.1 glycosyltransferase family 4 protein [Rhodanobacteraceae bacterium]
MLVPGLAPHDAVSNDARGMAGALRALGHEVALFAPHARGIDEAVLDPQTLHAWLHSREDVVIYHYCVGWDFALDLLRRTRARRIVRYHNITPPAFFEGWSPGYVNACAEGRAQLAAFAALGCELYLGDSPYNIEDFTSRGVAAERCVVLPPFHEIDELLALAPDARRIPRGGPLLLMVGRQSPNKGYLELIDALAATVADGLSAARLLLIGKLDPNLASYGAAVQARIAERGMQDHVVWLQDANGAELRAACEHAGMLVMLSRHEGFCVPLVEAMAIGTPVIALASSAMPSTLGTAGLLWPEDADAWLIAATIARVHADLDLRTTLRERGRQRYAEVFAPARLAAELARILREHGFA